MLMEIGVGDTTKILFQDKKNSQLSISYFSFK